eukprot:349719-Chlamydomonas_euryale.AAC.5
MDPGGRAPLDALDHRAARVHGGGVHRLVGEEATGHGERGRSKPVSRQWQQAEAHACTEERSLREH